MASAHFFTDESGDLRWTFTAPYRSGGSSRYLTIATLICPSEKRHIPKRVIKNLYGIFKWNPKKEKKWSDMRNKSREQFAEDAAKMALKHGDIKLFSITVAKKNVDDAIRRDENILYNYMIKLCLAEEMTKYDRVTLTLDARSIKVKSGNSLRDYLRIHLACERRVETELFLETCDSACDENVQFADMLAGVVQNHHEDQNSRCWNILRPHISPKTLFF